MIKRDATNRFHCALLVKVLRRFLLGTTITLLFLPVADVQASFLGYELQAQWRYDLRREDDNFLFEQTAVVGPGVEFNWNSSQRGFALICEPLPRVGDRCHWRLSVDVSESSILIAFDMFREPLLGFSFDNAFAGILINQLEFFDLAQTIPSIARLEFVSSTVPTIPDFTAPNGRWAIPNFMNGRSDEIIIELGGISALPPEPTDHLRHEILFDVVFEPAAVPIPAAVWLFGTALIGLVGFSKRRKAA